jgi:hypothetical protein
VRPATAAVLLAATLLATSTGHADSMPVCQPPAAKLVQAAAQHPSTALPAIACFAAPPPDRTCLASQKICDADLAVAKIAWKYFENNFQKTTGFVNAAGGYPSTTMWDIASGLMGTIAARELGLITSREFDDRIMPLLSTLMTQRLYHDEAPNKAYNTVTGEMTDYGNKVTTGIGYSALDLARLASALNILGCLAPKYYNSSKRVLERWKYGRIIKDGQMFGTAINPATKAEMVVQEGRLGYEQYAGKIWSMLGFDQRVSATYKNEFAAVTVIEGVPIAYDSRDPRSLGAYNFIVTESFVLDAMENGLDAANTELVKNVYEVQKRRWKKTNIVTAVSEDNVDRPPYFVYNTIFAAGLPWSAITDSGVDQSALRAVSTKAAFSLNTLFPRDPYSGVLAAQVANAYDEDKGWYSGVYESGIGYNKAITVNTNGIVLEGLLYKMFGALNAVCGKCGKTLKISVQANPSPAAYTAAK